MKYAHLSLLCMFVFIAISCNPTANNSSEVVRDLNPTHEPLQKPIAYAKAEIIKLETSLSCLITNIKQVEINDSHIFVLDSNNLYSFTHDGKFIAKIGNKGEGPSEYIGLSTFYVNDIKKQVTIIDDFKNLLLSYDYDGKFLSSTPVLRNSFEWCNYVLLTTDDKLLTYRMMSMNDIKPYSVFSLKKNKVIERYFSYQPITVDNYAYSFSAHPMALSGENIDVILPLCDTIFSYSPVTSSFSPKYIIETPQKMIPKDRIRERSPSYTEDVFKLTEQGYFPGFISIFETDTKVLLGYKYQGVQAAYFLFDKQSKSGNYYSLEWNEATKTLPFFPIVQSFKNQFVGQIDAESLIALKSIEDPEMKKIIESLKEDDNPCLILYKF